MWQPVSVLFYMIDFCLSAIVTVQVLLHKRNVRAAIGWIGLVWLSPFVGALLYFCFGINRVQRRARILRRSVRRPPLWKGASTVSSEPFANLKATVGTLTQQDLASAAISMPLNSGDDAYPQMLAAINNAKATIVLASYIFRSDRIGQDFTQALGQAVQRGVMVRVLLDGFGSGAFRGGTYRAFHALNIPVARFMSSLAPWRVQYLNLRLHKKILVVDGTVAFIGGLNIADENVRRFRRKPVVRDTHFRIEGPVVRQITQDFCDDWHFATGEMLAESTWNPQTQAQGTVEARAITSGPDQEFEKLTLVLMAAITSARKSIRISTPYFLPDDELMTALQLASTRGVHVHVVVPMVNDHRLVGWATLSHVSPLLDSGCRISRAPLPFDHSKLMVVDGSWCLFGSPNWDARSLRLNFELAIEAYDAALAAEISTIIEQSGHTPLTKGDLEARSLLVKCRDAASRLLVPYL
ncbi:MAG: cardiolipin synthase [Alphaproteobacteria bacterium]|nr:cardiolipin synthase [Alphaproteobacteria bacterium]